MCAAAEMTTRGMRNAGLDLQLVVVVVLVFRVDAMRYPPIRAAAQCIYTLARDA